MLNQQKSIFFIVILALLALSINAQRGQLIVQKQLDSEYPGLYAVNEPLTVSIKVFNVGSGSAYSVSIHDDWPSAFDVITGSTSGEWPELLASESITHNFTLVPRSEGQLASFSARVAYQPILDGPTQYASSTQTRNITIYPAEAYQRYTNTNTKEWTIIAAGLLSSIIIPLLVWANSRYSTETTAQSKKSK